MTLFIVSKEVVGGLIFGESENQPPPTLSCLLSRVIANSDHSGKQS
jgi:hypothetical protein